MLLMNQKCLIVFNCSASSSYLCEDGQENADSSYLIAIPTIKNSLDEHTASLKDTAIMFEGRKQFEVSKRLLSYVIKIWELSLRINKRKGSLI